MPLHTCTKECIFAVLFPAWVTVTIQKEMSTNILEEWAILNVVICLRVNFMNDDVKHLLFFSPFQNSKKKMINLAVLF